MDRFEANSKPSSSILDQIPSDENLHTHFPPVSPPSKPNFLTYSFPDSSSSSPKFGPSQLRKKSRILNQPSPLQIHPFHRQDSIALANLERLRRAHLSWSKSSEDLRFQLKETKQKNQENSHVTNINFHKGVVEAEKNNRVSEQMDDSEKEFKCGALCLFMPGFGRTKQVKSKMDVQEIVVSKRVSLQKFECGSWRSSAIMGENDEDRDTSSLFFDLPIETIRFSVSETHSPVTTTFLFDKDRKGALKKSSTMTSNC